MPRLTFLIALAAMMALPCSCTTDERKQSSFGATATEESCEAAARSKNRNKEAGRGHRKDNRTRRSLPVRAEARRR